jgi:hypothetical protein
LRWQTAIAAAIAAVATVVAALIATSSGGSDKDSASAKPGGVSSAAATPSVSFTSWSEKPAAPKGKEYEFEGRVSDLPAGFSLHVVIEVPRYGPKPLDGSSPGAVGTEWLVSPAADVLRDGGWKLVWKVDHPPAGARWVVVVLGNCEPCTGGSAAMGGLRADGPRDPDVVARATAPAKSPG